MKSKKSKSKSRSRSRSAGKKRRKSASKSKSRKSSKGKRSCSKGSKGKRSRSKSCSRKCTKPSDYDDSKAVFFKGFKKIKYEGPKSHNPLAFKYYNPNEVVLGKKMKDWLRFSVVFWHTFRGVGTDPFGG